MLLSRCRLALIGLSAFAASCGGGGGSNGAPAPSPSFRVEVTIQPLVATGDDELHAMPIVNPANASLSISYEWRRNGTVLPGRNAATLPPGQHRRDDLISVTVRATNGAATAEATRSIRIADAPPRVVVAAAPSINFGAAFTGEATIFDADGDTHPNLQFRLQYGPAGLTVHPVSGVIDWIATMPMMDRAVDVNLSIGTDDPLVPAGTATVRVIDPSGTYPLARTGLPVPFQHNLRVGDFDGDGAEEMLMLGEDAFYELRSASTSSYRQAWAYPFAISGDNIGRSFTVGDTDGDRRFEIFIAAERTIAKLDGAERRVVLSMEQDDAECQQLEYADLRDDGNGEIVCLGQESTAGSVTALVVFSAGDLSQQWRFPDAPYGSAIAIGNVDDDAALEIVSAAGYVFDGATFAAEWLHSDGFGQDVAAGDLDKDGVAEIVGIRGAAGQNGVRAFDARPGARRMLWQFTTPDQADSILLADADGDAVTDIVIGQFLNVIGYHFDPAANMAQTVFRFQLPFAQELNARALGVGDVDRDGQTELIWATNGRRGAISVAAVTSQQVEWTSAPPKQLGPIVGGAVARSGAADALVFATGATNDSLDGPRLMTMQRDSGDTFMSAELAGGAGRVALATTDVDGDLVDEALVWTNSNFFVYDPFGATIEWQEAASAFVPVAVAVGDITGDGRPDAVSLFEDGTVIAHDVYGRKSIWSAFVANLGRDVIIADLNSDSSPEIVVATERVIAAYTRTSSYAFAQTRQYSAPTELHLLTSGDTDGDGAVEVFAVMGDTEESQRVQILDSALKPLSDFALRRFVSDIALEPTPYSRRNLLLASVDDVDHDDDPSTVETMDARTGAVIWRSPRLTGPISPAGLYYHVAPTGRPVLTFATEAGMYLTR